METNKIRAAIVGYGNIGHYVLESVLGSPDFELAGIVRRDPSDIPHELQPYKVAGSIDELGKVDVALLCTPTRRVEGYAIELLGKGICTVDSYDNHSGIVELRRNMMEAARKGGSVAVLSAGWDPGTDSMVRALMELCAPKGVTYTNFGPGMSMGHTVAVKAIEGVGAALSMTIPTGTGVHRRMVYIEVLPGHTLEEVAAKIKADAYFVNDETIVTQVDSVDALLDMGHGVNIVRKGVSGNTQNQRFEFNMSIDNPALTAQIIVASARAAMKQSPGAYTMIEIPLIDYLYGDAEDLIHRLV